MRVGWGLVVVALSLLAWGGQTLAWLAPARAQRLGLAEADDSVEPVFAADGRGEARWDAATLWILMVAGILLIVGNGAWAYFGLVGGGVYLYFAGRGISARMEMQDRGFRIGTADNVKVGYLFLAIWGLVAVITIVAAAVALDSDSSGDGREVLWTSPSPPW